MLKINGKIVTDVVYKGKRIERIYVGSKKYYDMYDGRISGYAIEAGRLSIGGKTYSYGAGYFDIYIGDIGSNNIGTLFANTKIGTLTHIGIDTRSTNYMGGAYNTWKGMFSGCSSLTSLDVSKFDTSKVTTMYCMFYGCSSLTSLDVSHFDTSKVQIMDNMFSGCSSLTSLDVSHFDTSKVTTMYFMFSGCSSLTSLDVSHFDTGNVQSMKSMFSGCSSLTSLDVSHFDTSKVQIMDNMFSGCSSLTSLDVSHFDTSKVTTMNCMFYDCSSLTSLDVSHFDTSKVQSMDLMFSGCSSLTSLDVSHFDTGNVHDMDLMFYGCSNMRTLNIGNMDLSGLTDNMSRTFRDCSSLRSITGQFVGLKLSISFGWSPLLDHDSAMMVINSAETVTTVQTVSFSSQTKALLSDEEKAILTNKGWTLA